MGAWPAGACWGSLALEAYVFLLGRWSFEIEIGVVVL
jgi:hypothetical protein